MPLKSPKAIIFDMDGLLLDTEVLYRDAMIGACSELGYEMPAPVHRATIGVPVDRVTEILLGNFGSDFPISGYYERCSALFRDRCSEAVPVKPGAIELLEELGSKCIPAAVATSTRRTTATRYLTNAGLINLVQAVVTRDDVEKGKPDPETFLKAAGLLGVNPADCWALEDSTMGCVRLTPRG